MKAKLLLLLCLSMLPAIGQAQTVDRQKLNSFATAIAHAEGFGPKGHLPTRYHNPGDLKSAATYTPLPGQKTLGKGGHIVFKNDTAGWTALRDYLSKMVDGRSRRFKPDMTLAQVSRVYAGNWHPWLNIVTKELGVPSNVRLRDLLLYQESEPPQIVIADVKVSPFDFVPSTPLPPADNNQPQSEDFQY
jgi:hypothetical protein